MSFSSGQIKQVVVARMIGQIESALLNGDFRDRLLAPRAFELLVFREDLGFVTAVIVIGEFEENETEDRRGILARFQVGVGAQIIRGAPEIGFELFKLVFRHATFNVGLFPTRDEYTVKPICWRLYVK